MKQELVRTKSKISSLKREMSSIQQLHLAQQQAQGQLSAPTILLNRQKHEPYHHHLLCPSHPQAPIFTYKAEHRDPTESNHDHYKKKHSTSSNEEPLSPSVTTTNHPTCSAQSTQTTSRSPPSTIMNFSNLILSSSSSPNSTSNDQQTQQQQQQQPHLQPRRSFSLTPSSTKCDSSTSVSDEQLRLYLTETLQREKDSAV